MTATGGRVGCSVLCPGGVRTQIAAASRNRPEEQVDRETRRIDASEAAQRTEDWANRIGETGQDPSEIAEKVFQAINDDQFYILTHTTQDPGLRLRFDNILARRNPELVEQPRG